MKTKKIVILILTTCVVCLSVLSGCAAMNLVNASKRRRRFEERFAFELPADAKLVYYHGETTRDGTDEYYAWQFENEPAYFLNSDKYKIKVKSTETGEEAEQIKQYFQKGAEKNIGMHSNEVPQNCRPNWEDEFFCFCRYRSSYGLDSEIRIGPSCFYDVNQKLLIAWYIAT